MPFLGNTHFCRNMCGEIFKTWYCQKCKRFITNMCKDCHEECISEIKRMSDLAKLKRDSRFIKDVKND